MLAMIGSGGMARSYAEAIKQVRPIEVMRVFSPTRANREAFAAEMTEKLDMEVIPVDSPEKALKGADVVSLTTDSLVPVIKAAWLEPGMHINNVRNNEAGPDVLARADVRARLGTSTLVRRSERRGSRHRQRRHVRLHRRQRAGETENPVFAAPRNRQSKHRHRTRHHGRPLGR